MLNLTYVLNSLCDGLKFRKCVINLLSVMLYATHLILNVVILVCFVVLYYLTLLKYS